MFERARFTLSCEEETSCRLRRQPDRQKAPGW